MSRNIYIPKIIVKYLGLLFLIIILIKIDFSGIYGLLAKTDNIILIFTILINIPHIFIKSIRWNLLLRQQGICLTYINSLTIYFSSLYLGFITPGRLGEFSKVLYLNKYENVPIAKALPSVVIDRIFDLILLIILSSYGIWRMKLLEVEGTIYVVTIILILFVIVVKLKIKDWTSAYKYLIFRFLPDKINSSVYNSVETIMAEAKIFLSIRLTYIMLLTVLGYTIFFIQCYLLAKSLNIPLNIVYICIFMSIGNLISFIPISISGLGTRDATLIFLFSLKDIQPEVAVSYSMLIFFTFFICGSLMGAYAWWLKPLKFEKFDR